MSSNEGNRRRSASMGAAGSGLRRRNVQRAPDETVMPTPPRRQPPSQLDQHQAVLRTQNSRLSMLSSVVSYAVPRAASLATPLVGVPRAFHAAVTSVGDTVDHLRRGELRQAGASSLSALGSALTVAHVPLAPSVLSAASGALNAPETIQQYQSSVATAIAKARTSGVVSPEVLEPANRQFKTMIRKQD